MRSDVFDNGWRSQTVDALARGDLRADVGGRNIDQWYIHHARLERGEVGPELRPAEFVARPRHDDEIDLAEKRFGLAPGWQAVEHVGADQPVDVIPALFFELPGRIDGVTWAVSARFYIVDREQVVAGDGQLAHSEAVGGGCQIGVREFMWRLAGWDEDNLTKTALLGIFYTAIYTLLAAFVFYGKEL